MPLFRVAGMLAILAVLSACKKPTENPSAPRLPELALPDTTEGAPYEVSLAASGGTAPLYYSAEALPPGLSLYTGPGLLKGPATVAGQYTFTVRVEDASRARDTRTYQLLVHPAPVITATTLPSTQVGTPYAAQLQAHGGKAPLRWALTSGALPADISLSEDGELAGIAREPGTYGFSARVRDAHGVEAARAFALEVRPGVADGGLSNGDGGTDGGTDDGGTLDGGTSDGGTTDAGSAMPFSAANWNIEWFGSSSNGPWDDALQLDNVQAVIADAGVDFWGLAELVDEVEFNELKQRLPGYGGFMANDSNVVWNGASHYSYGEQKVGVLFRADVVSVQSAGLILTEYSSYFAGRPPLRVDLRVTRDGVSVDLVAIVLHMKAFADESSYNTRKNAGTVLKSYLDTELPNARVLVLGDWNDDVDVSIVKVDGGALPSPYENFVTDPANHTFVTRPLALAGQRSTVSYPDFIDHQLVSNELAAHYVSGSAQVLKPAITSYKSTTSDHYPVLSRYDFGDVPAPPPPPLRLIFPNGGEQLTSSTVQTITWTTDGVGSVKLEYFDGLSWLLLAPSVPAASGQYTWTVPSDWTTQARVRVSDATAPAISDVSDAPFSVTGPPPVFINEVLPHEPALPDGGRDYAQQFVEVVNGSSVDTVDLGGWRLNDASGYSNWPPRHLFAAGTLLGPGKAHVVYSGVSALPAGATNASAASSGGLYFNKGINHPPYGEGDTAYLQSPTGSLVDSFDYSYSHEAISYNREPDTTQGGSFTLHTGLNPALGSSPGRRADGGTF